MNEVDLLPGFLNFIEKESLIKPHQKVLLAVSGGVDSMVMMHLFSRTKFHFAIAHCNFKLRGKDSDADARLVLDYANSLNLPVFSTAHDTLKYARQHKLSIQMAARQLRYAWLDDTARKNGYHLIATAHHLNDNIETLFLHLLQGTGIRGMKGIMPKNNNLIRPLLFASKDQIIRYASHYGVPFREDASNLGDDYLRNRIRHQLIPVIEHLQPAWLKVFERNIANFRDAVVLYEWAVGRIKSKLIEQRGNEWYIPLRKLINYQPRRTLLHELLSPFGFNTSQVEQVIDILDDEPGKKVLSADYYVLKDRQFLIVIPRDTSRATRILIEKPRGTILTPDFRLKISLKPVTPSFVIPKSPAIACLDKDKLQFPLILRRWRQGDYFYPFGLKKASGKPARKKLSDFLTDLKLPLHEKERTWVLTSGDKIAWVVNHRIDERFKITGNTRQALVLEVKPLKG